MMYPYRRSEEEIRAVMALHKTWCDTFMDTIRLLVSDKYAAHGIDVTTLPIRPCDCGGLRK